jgi:hypothetical protein
VGLSAVHKRRRRSDFFTVVDVSGLEESRFDLIFANVAGANPGNGMDPSAGAHLRKSSAPCFVGSVIDDWASSESVLRFLSEVQNVERQNVEIQIVGI